MAAETFRIEIPIRVEDKTDPGVSQATRKINGFDKANQKTQERLNQMNRTKYQVVLDAMDRASGIIGKVSSKARGIAGKTFSFTMKVLDRATAPLRGLWNLATSIQGAILGATGAFAGIYKPMSIAGDFEQTQIAFETMLKSADKANKFMKDAATFANKTPFEFPELINSSKLLLAFGFEADKVLDLMTIIGDTSSGLGAGSEGIDRITRALGQMQAKGRAQAEELLQLQELGVPANQILQEELGLTGEQVANIGKEGIEASKVIDALLRGMEKRYGGMMENQSRTAKGMISTLKDTLENSLLRPWGTGLWEGIKPGLEKVTTWLDENQEIVAEWGEAWKKAGANISKWVMTKVEDLQGSIRRMTNSQEWKDAQTFGAKMKVAWDQIIAQPFNEWWNSTGKAWLSEKAGKIGEGIGTALSAGLLTLLGVDVSGATEDGVSIGASFAEGFSKGFDGKKVGEAILNAIKGVFSDAGTLLPGGEEASSTSWLSTGAIALALSKLGIFKLIGKGGKGLMSLFGKGSQSGMPTTGSPFPDTFATSSMYVTAAAVYINGPTFNNGMPNINTNPMPNIPRLPGGGANPQLPGGSTLALPGAGGAAAAGKAYTVYAPAGKGASVVMGTAGSAVTAGLANTGYALGSGATTIGGAAAVGGASIAGIIGGILGLGSAGIDIYQGVKASKAGNSKAAKDEYVTAGTKTGMVGAGAAAGAGIGALFGGVGAVPGALIGAGIGGAASLFAGDKVGKTLSDSTDKGGGLATFWENTKKTASSTWESVKTGASNAGTWVSDKWNEAGDLIGNKWSGFSDWFDTSVWTPAKDIGISAINIATGAWGEGKDWIGDKWSDFSGWFNESVWTPVSDAAQAAGEWVGEKWGETKTFIGDKWSDFSSWFDESVWTPVSNAAQTAGQWVSDRWGEARTWVGDRWSDFSGWFEESIWTPVKNGAQAAGSWVGERWSEAKTFVSETWANVSGWFSETVWEPVKGAAAIAGTWLGEKFTLAKGAVQEAWTGVSGWFEESIWTPVKNGAQAAGSWVGERWSEAKTFVSETWANVSGWFSETVWEPVKGAAAIAGTWLGEKFTLAKGAVQEAWTGVSGWFEESIWTPVKNGAQAAGSWVGERWSEAKTFVSETWANVSGWFSETVWEPVKGAAAIAGTWLGEKFTLAKGAVQEAWTGVSGWFEESIWTPVKNGAQAAGSWVGERWSEAKTFVSETWANVSGWFSETVWEPVKGAAAIAGTWLGEKFTLAKGAVQEAWTGVSGWFEENVWGPIKTGASNAWEWVGEKLGGIGEWMGDKWTSFKDWLGGLGQKGSKETGLTTSEGKGSVLEHAWGGIMTKPHMGIVAEDGAEGIIPLSPSKRSRGINLWQRTGELLGVQPYEDGGIVGSEPRRIPTGVPTSTGNNITIKVEVKAEPKFTIEGDGGATDENRVLEVLKGYIREMTDDIGDELAERLARIFANMPVKGGAEA